MKQNATPPPLPSQGPTAFLAVHSNQRPTHRRTRLLIAVLAAALFVLALILIAGIVIAAHLSARGSDDPMKIAARGDTDLESTLRAMQVTAGIGDWEGFSRYVDVPALRSSLREINSRSLAEARKKGEADVVDSIFSELIVGAILNKYVTEENLPQIMRYFALAISIADDGSQPDPNVKRFAYFAGSDIFVIAGENAKTKERGYLIFRKDRAAGWRLAGLTDKKP